MFERVEGSDLQTVQLSASQQLPWGAVSSAIGTTWVVCNEHRLRCQNMPRLDPTLTEQDKRRSASRTEALKRTDVIAAKTIEAQQDDRWNHPTVGLEYTTVPPIHLGSDVLSRNIMILCTSIFIGLGSLHKDPLAMYGPLAAKLGILCYKVFDAWRNHTANHAEKNSPGLPLFSDPQQVMTSSTHCTEFCIEALGEETTATPQMYDSGPCRRTRNILNLQAFDSVLCWFLVEFQAKD
ncbi:MAG: hypothetical protein LQ341_003964 [Variospora aurantia]|nr:MAG: hypothetical protein LQ341_003964 [Variospora aurantia]